ncbi:MAG: BACON domain-containing protein [Polyangiaceae bacterium]|nr:BACON domain-containing protein [Polyangiaceae bacterium]
MSRERPRQGEGGISLLPPQGHVFAGDPRPNEATIEVTAPPDLEWAASARAPWITIVSGAEGRGSGRVAYGVAPNPGAPRHGAVDVGGVPFPVFQLAAPVWLAQMTWSAPMPYIEQVGLDGFIKKLNELPPAPRAAAYAALFRWILSIFARARGHYEGAAAVPHAYTRELLEHELEQAIDYVMKHMVVNE